MYQLPGTQQHARGTHGRQRQELSGSIMTSPALRRCTQKGRDLKSPTSAGKTGRISLKWTRDVVAMWPGQGTTRHAHGAIQDSMTQRATAGEHRYAPITSPSNNRYDGDTRSGELTTWTDAARYLTSIRTTRHRGALMDSAASLSSAVRGTVNAVIVACIKAARHVMSDPPNPFTPTWLATSTFL